MSASYINTRRWVSKNQLFNCFAARRYPMTGAIGSERTRNILYSCTLVIKFLTRLILIVGIPLCVAVATYTFLTHAFVAPVDKTATDKKIVEVRSGMNFSQICNELYESGLLRYKWSIELLARLNKRDAAIKAGEYELSQAMSPREILAKLVSGEMLQRIVTVKEGTSIWDIGQLVETAGLVSAEAFNRTLTNASLLAKAGIAASSFEGYLFPETYSFSRPVTPEQIVWRMMEQGDKRWKPEYSVRAEDFKLTRHEILTLASIIEKESGNADEQPIVSSVFHNRLAQNMRLQSDPTVIYGIKDFDGNLKKADLLEPHPYNTYVNFGLPPGPICNPGATAIAAALYPADTSYLFFVGDGEGRHVFATTLQEHNANVLKYQLGGKRPKEEDPTPTAVPEPKKSKLESRLDSKKRTFP